MESNGLTGKTTDCRKPISNLASRCETSRARNRDNVYRTMLAKMGVEVFSSKVATTANAAGCLTFLVNVAYHPAVVLQIISV